jgi:lysophospholipase L1-like esterase
VLKGCGTERYYDVFREEVKKRSEAVKRIADKYNLKFVPLQDKFDEAAAGGNDTYWLADGVHPTAAGHCLIKDEMMKIFE